METVYKENHLLWLAKLEELPLPYTLSLFVDPIHSTSGEMVGMESYEIRTLRTERNYGKLFFENRKSKFWISISKVSFSLFHFKNCFDFKKQKMKIIF